MVEEITRDHFAACIPSEFQLADDSLVLELTQVSELQISGPFEIFSLTFKGPGDRLLPQRIYSLEHNELGKLDIFLVPISRDQGYFYYEAVFNRQKTTGA